MDSKIQLHFHFYFHSISRSSSIVIQTNSDVEKNHRILIFFNVWILFHLLSFYEWCLNLETYEIRPTPCGHPTIFVRICICVLRIQYDEGFRRYLKKKKTIRKRKLQSRLNFTTEIQIIISLYNIHFTILMNMLHLIFSKTLVPWRPRCQRTVFRVPSENAYNVKACTWFISWWLTGSACAKKCSEKGAVFIFLLLNAISVLITMVCVSCPLFQIYNVILHSFNYRRMHISPHRPDPLWQWPEAKFTSSHIIMMRAMRAGAHFCSLFAHERMIYLLARIRNHVACLQPVYGLQSNHLLFVNKTYILVLAHSESHTTRVLLWDALFRFFFLHGIRDIRAIFPFNLFGVKFSQTENIIAYFPGLMRLQSPYIGACAFFLSKRSIGLILCEFGDAFWYFLLFCTLDFCFFFSYANWVLREYDDASLWRLINNNNEANFNSWFSNLLFDSCMAPR